MRTILRPIMLALLLVAAPAMSAPAANAIPAANAAPAAAAATQGSAAAYAEILAASAATPSPGDSASTGPANPGTGESGENESTRVDFAPWVIGGIAVVTLIVVLIWRRRRNTTIV